LISLTFILAASPPKIDLGFAWEYIHFPRSQHPSPCKRLKDGTGADSRKSQLANSKSAKVVLCSHANRSRGSILASGPRGRRPACSLSATCHWPLVAGLPGLGPGLMGYFGSSSSDSSSSDEEVEELEEALAKSKKHNQKLKRQVAKARAKYCEEKEAKEALEPLEAMVSELQAALASAGDSSELEARVVELEEQAAASGARVAELEEQAAGAAGLEERVSELEEELATAAEAVEAAEAGMVAEAEEAAEVKE
jgi:hypothetical protein